MSARRVGVVLWLVACQGEPVRLGTGDRVWEPLADGDEIDVIFGPQGGYHLLASVRTKDLEPGVRDDLSSPLNPTVTFTAWDQDVQLIPNASFTQGLDEIEGGPDDEGYTHEMVGRLAILDIADDDDLVGRELVFEVEVTDADGEVYRDERRVIAVKNRFND